jgi:hypothetical protein
VSAAADAHKTLEELTLHSWLTDSKVLTVQVKVRVMLRPTVSRTACLGVRPPSLCNILSDEKMGFSLISMLGLSSSVHFAHNVTENSSFCTTHKSSVSKDYAEQIMPVLCNLCYNGSLVTWSIVSLTTSYIVYVWLRLVLCCEYVHPHGFVWLLLVACTIFLYNHMHTESWKLCANRGPVCTFENFQWYAENCFEALKF